MTIKARLRERKKKKGGVGWKKNEITVNAYIDIKAFHTH